MIAYLMINLHHTYLNIIPSAKVPTIWKKMEFYHLNYIIKSNIFQFQILSQKFLPIILNSEPISSFLQTTVCFYR